MRPNARRLHSADGHDGRTGCFSRPHRDTGSSDGQTHPSPARIASGQTRAASIIDGTLCGAQSDAHAHAHTRAAGADDGRSCDSAAAQKRAAFAARTRENQTRDAAKIEILSFNKKERTGHSSLFLVDVPLLNPLSR